MTKIPGEVTGSIFDYRALIRKLDREIERLKLAEFSLSEDDAFDHALNAAFTAYALLEWQEIALNPSKPAKARDIVNKENDTDLNLLHDIVTAAKHLTISDSAYKAPINVRASAAAYYQLEPITIMNTSPNRLIVKFDNDLACMILERISKRFKPIE